MQEHTQIIQTRERGVGNVDEKVPMQKKVVFRGYQLIWYVVGVIEVLLAFRLGLKLLAANPRSGFTSLVYGVSEPLVAAFAGVFKTPTSNGSVLELSTLLAMMTYLVAGWLIVELLKFIKPTNAEEVDETVSNI